MRDKLFDELVASVREGGAILRGERTPSRQSVMKSQSSSAFGSATSTHNVESPPLRETTLRVDYIDLTAEAQTNGRNIASDGTIVKNSISKANVPVISKRGEDDDQGI